MTAVRNEAWKQTASGRAFHLLDPQPEEICLEDIAHALACVNRYGGHAPEPYSVAQHSLLVSERAYVIALESGRLVEEAVEIARWGLMHDAAEAYLGDMVSPLKKVIPEFKLAEAKVMRAICARFGLVEKQPEPVTQADRELMATEAAVFFPEQLRPAPWPQLTRPPLAGVDVRPWDWRVAKGHFLARWRELWGNR